jgi:hypothetical protein
MAGKYADGAYRWPAGAAGGWPGRTATVGVIAAGVATAAVLGLAAYWELFAPRW